MWSQVTELWQLYAIGIGIGVVSAMMLYESAFAVVARMFGADYRKAIIVITLFGGLASTVFVPLTQFLVSSLGWRHALTALAVIQLPFCAGIPFVLLRGRETLDRGTSATRGATTTTSIRAALSHPVFWLLALSFVSYAFLFTSLVFNLVPMLREKGYTTTEAVTAYAFIGPFQLAGRMAILTLERFISVTVAGLIGTLFPVLAMVVMMTLQAHSPLVLLFAIAFGTGMGIKTIVQATAAPEFLGRAGYGALQGALMVPVYLAQALSPFLAAGIWQLREQYDLLQFVLLLTAGVSAAAFMLAARLRPHRIAPSPAAAL
jgi:MFS family permease